MNRAAIEREILRLLSETFQITVAEELAAEADLFDLGLNSANVVRFLFSLEDSFGLEFDLEDLSAERFGALAPLVDLVDRRLNASHDEFFKPLMA